MLKLESAKAKLPFSNVPRYGPEGVKVLAVGEGLGRAGPVVRVGEGLGVGEALTVGEGETVGCLDPDYYFRSFEMFDRDIINNITIQTEKIKDFVIII